jgi:hypothetical protein
MQALFKAPRASLIFSLIAIAGLGIFIVAVGVLMQPAVQLVGQDRTSELVCLQLAFTPERASEVLLAFDAAGREGVAGLLIPGDFTLAWGYGLVLFGLLGLLLVRLPESWQQLGAIFIWAPLVASLLDCIENIFLYAIVTQLIDNPDVLVSPMLTLAGSSVASLKWIALAVVTPVFGFAATAKGIAVDRRVTSWVVYLLLSISLLSMVIKPIQDFPACF